MAGIQDMDVIDTLPIGEVKERAALAVRSEVTISGSIVGVASEMPQTVELGHWALMGPGNQWVLDVKCRTPNSRSNGILSWESLSKVCPDAKVEVKHNSVTVILPPLQEELEIVTFGKPGENDMKRMQLAVFGRKPRNRKEDWFVNVVLCDDTVTAFQEVRQEEEERGNKLLTVRAGLFVANIDEDIKVNLISLQPEWNFKGSKIMKIKSRYAWWNQPTGFFRCRLPVGFPNVEKTEKFFLWGVTASHGADTATAELITVFEQHNGTDIKEKKDGEVWEDLKAQWIPNVASFLSWYAFLALHLYDLAIVGYVQYHPELFLFEAFWITICAFWINKLINFSNYEVCRFAILAIYCVLLFRGFTARKSDTTEVTVAEEDPEVAKEEWLDSSLSWRLSRENLESYLICYLDIHRCSKCEEFRDGDSGSVISRKKRVVSEQDINELAMLWMPEDANMVVLRPSATRRCAIRVVEYERSAQAVDFMSGGIRGNHSSQLRKERNESYNLQPRGSVDGLPICDAIIQTLSSEEFPFRNDIVKPYLKSIF